MNKIYVTGDIHCRIEKFDEYFAACDSSDTIYQLGDIIFKSGVDNDNPDIFHSMATLLYFYNLTHNKKNPTIKLIRGNHEGTYKLNRKHFYKYVKDLEDKDTSEIEWQNDFSIYHDFLLTQNLKMYDASVSIPTAAEIFDYFNQLPYKIETTDYLFVHGWINPEWNDFEHLISDFRSKDRKGIATFSLDQPWFGSVDYGKRNGYTWGTAANIYDGYAVFCKENNLPFADANSFALFQNDSQYHYFGFKSLQEYNDWIKNHFNKIMFVGHRPDPLKTTFIQRPYWLSNIYFCDTGVGYSDKIEDTPITDKITFQKNLSEKMFFIDITDKNHFIFSMFPLPLSKQKEQETFNYLLTSLPKVSWETSLKDFCKLDKDNNLEIVKK